MDKSDLRKFIKQAKARVGVEERKAASESVMQHLEAYANFKQAKTVLCYWALDDEVDTRDMVMRWYKKKRIYLPVVVGEDLEFRLFEGMDKMKPEAHYGILEPTGVKLENPDDLDLAIIPGVAFDWEGNRCGRGKGFYDRILESIHCEKVGVCFDFQLVDALPVEEHDKKMDTVMSETEQLFLM